MDDDIRVAYAVAHTSEGGEHIASIRDIPGVEGRGASLEEALEALSPKLAEFLFQRVHANEPLPVATPTQDGEMMAAISIARGDPESDEHEVTSKVTMTDGFPLPSEVFKPSGHTSVMNNRHDRNDVVQDFPTPPWGTRALAEHLKRLGVYFGTVLEPAAGRGLMSGVLGAYFQRVLTADAYDYGLTGCKLASYVQPPEEWAPDSVDWMITNPPFALMEAFLARALVEARFGVAMLTRLPWLDTQGRYERIFSINPPTQVLIFSERLAMYEGRWVPGGSTATGYCWVLWIKGRDPLPLAWVPVGSRDRLSFPADLIHYAHAIKDNPIEDKP